MLRNVIWIALLGLIVGGCATDGKIESSSDSTSSTDSTAVSRPTMSSPETSTSSTTMADRRPADAGSTMSGSAGSMSQSNSSQNRVAAGIEEDTLDTCLSRIPKDATAGQRMLAEQTCRRDFSVRR